MTFRRKQIYLTEGLLRENYPVLLKCLTDLEVVAYWYSAKRMVEFKTIDDITNFVAEEPDEIFWEMYTTEGVFIGFVSLYDFKEKERCGFSILILDKNYWGRGIGLEAITLMLHYAFNKLEMKTVVLETSEFHKSAIRLYEKVGFKKTDIVPNDRTIFHDGKWILSGTVIMELKRSDFASLAV